MWIAMTLYISGGRADGRDWPDPGVAFEVPDQEGADLLRAKHAVRVQPPPRSTSSSPLPGPASVTPAPVSEPAFTAAGPVPEPDPDPLASPPVPVNPPLPKPYAPKAEWVNYARAHGDSEDAANLATKEALIAKYGGRL
jgi:hypothetical protein